MKAFRILALMFLMVAIFATSCAVKTKKLRLDTDDNINALTGPEVESDLAYLNERIVGLWSSLEQHKLTAYMTKRKISPYFKNEKDLTEFIAIYASLFRILNFDREIVRKYKIKQVILEPNGAIALVDIIIKGRIFFIWQAKIHEVQRWVKSEGNWYLAPQAY